MQAKFILASIAGASILHVILLACSDSKSSLTANANAQQPDGGASPVEMYTAPCDKTFEVTLPPLPGAIDGGTRSQRYAEQAMPGRTAAEIAGRVTNWHAIQDGGKHGGRAPWSELD